MSNTNKKLSDILDLPEAKTIGGNMRDRLNASTAAPPAIPAAPSPFALARIPSLAEQELADGFHYAWMYFVGATHLRNLLKPLGVTAFKGGISGCRDVGERVLDLRRKKYASVAKYGIGSDTPSVDLLLSHEWFLVPIRESDLNGIPLPDGISLVDGCLRLRIPTRLSITVVDQAVANLLADRELNRYLGSADGRQRLAAAGYDPNLQLWTRYALMGPELRESKACEIVLIRVRREISAFAAALAAMIAKM